MLSIREVSARYGQLQVLKKVSLHVEKGEVVSLLGANGAGKTTILKTITGGVTVTSGEVQFKGKNITHLAGDAVARLKIAHVPENRRVFRDLNVEENLMLGGIRFVRSKAELQERMEGIYRLFPRLLERRRQLAGTLSGGEQQMLAIGRGLMMEPELLILDEPSQGLAPKIVEDIFRVIRQQAQEGRTILLVEQNIYQALSISNRGYVVKNGEIIISGEAKELMQRQDIKEAYLH